MATIEEGLYARLSGTAGVTALVSTRIYPMAIPQDITLPAIAYQRISGLRIPEHDGPSGLATGRVQFTCQGTSYSSAKAVATAVRAALDCYSGAITVGAGSVTVESCFLQNEYDGFELETESRTVRLDFLIMYKEE